VLIDGVEATGFSELRLPELVNSIVEYREGDDPELSDRKAPGRQHFGPAHLSRGFRGTLELYEWWKQVGSGAPNGRRGVLIQLLDEARAVVFEWVLHEAWPSRYFFSPLIGHNGDVLYEHAEIACESVELRNP